MLSHKLELRNVFMATQAPHLYKFSIGCNTGLLISHLFVESVTYLPRASLMAQLVKNLPAMQETPSSITGSGRSPGEGKGYLLQDSWAPLVAQLVKKICRQCGKPRLDRWEDALEKGMATHSHILAWKIPWTV